MNIKIQTEKDIIIISVEGSIDSYTAPEFQKKILSEAEQTSKIILDLSLVTFVSSAGLRVLLMVYRQIKSKNGKIILVGISEEIKEVMTMTGFINFFEIVTTIEEALIHF
ncbi:MAG: anti-sigma B factor antagonist [Bacteroidetes bacterium RIFOXYA12_FULL_35_11]|nr:MAG: anti-sigma B factor antagonist [Bacteroidetes bacterium GWF2_35_48]OFY82291.1 MAG: anti-sigma B factor antagonist [Bacteroidetes bacterium RIFOXYA12_FULL_35_11]OFY96776.1 MAG: anti-sigma B factor antagonist [Bacteroidetes bacterium RIFOXYB2_FULL_35_7]OFZ01251.1 MAG: anti-sigma B factor antagonist [Bacteroidetes bacterium RIFOXYC12_FULL_35_7]HBX53653.1 anti-sigma B factor antagonist [Bacteroidales bacterium]